MKSVKQTKENAIKSTWSVLRFEFQLIFIITETCMQCDAMLYAINNIFVKPIDMCYVNQFIWMIQTVTQTKKKLTPQLNRQILEGKNIRM